MRTLKVPFETAEDVGSILELNVPDNIYVKDFTPKELPPLADPAAEVLRAVESPVESPAFSKLIQGGKTVVFMIENQFRAAPANLLLPGLVEMVKKAGGNAKIVIGCGKVPPLSDEEIKEKIGAALFDSGIPVFCNDVSKEENYTLLGITKKGIPLWLHNEVVQSDVKVTVGTTQATLWGYGGSGMVIPGSSGDETIELNHIMSLSPTCVPGNNDADMQHDKYEALKMAGVDMGINVIVNNDTNISYINAGDPVASHKKSVEVYDSVYSFGKEEQFDIVICGSTAPTNHLFFHTSWAVVNCDPIAKDSSTILFASPCPGYGGWEGFALMDLMQEYMPPTKETHEKALRDFYNRKKELWAGCIWYKVYELMLRKHTTYITFEENLDFAKKLQMDAYGPGEIQNAFDKTLAEKGPDAKVAFVPYGRYTVFK